MSTHTQPATASRPSQHRIIKTTKETQKTHVTSIHFQHPPTHLTFDPVTFICSNGGYVSNYLHTDPSLSAKPRNSIS